MSSKCSRILNRCSISTIKSAICKANPSSVTRAATTSFAKPSVPSKSAPSNLLRFSLSRSPAELGAVASMLPLHSAVSLARMTSCLSTTSRSCRALSQGTLCCTTTDL